MLLGAFGAAAKTPWRPPPQHDEQQIRVRQTFAALKPQHTALILLREDGLSHAELAAALDLNPASVGTALARAAQAFRKEYVKRYGQTE